MAFIHLDNIKVENTINSFNFTFKTKNEILYIELKPLV